MYKINNKLSVFQYNRNIRHYNQNKNMKFKSFFILSITTSIILSCGIGNKNQEAISLEEEFIKTEDLPQPLDKLEEGKTYRTKSGVDIFCLKNNESSAKLATEDFLSEEEIYKFIKDKEVKSEKSLTFYYKNLNIPYYASVIDGVLKYNKEIPNSLEKAKLYKKKLDDKLKKEKAEKERLAKIEKEKNKKTIIGEWLNAGYPICIYKQRGKYYLGQKNGEDENDIHEYYEITRVSSKRYENRDNGDMPERFDIMKNGDIKTTVYNPDAPGGGAWVYMGTWMSLNR